MNTINDGGQAFPSVRTDQKCENGQFYGNVHSTGGMSLRDWFAGQALAGSLTNPSIAESIVELSNARNTPVAVIRATYCYELADAVILQRNKQP